MNDRPATSFHAHVGREFHPDDPDVGAELVRIAAFYDRQARTLGPVPQAVLWYTEQAQTWRYNRLLRVIPWGERWRGGLTIADLGCGYGALFDHVAGRRLLRGGAYVGYDIAPAMIATARQRVQDPRARFELADRVLAPADYVLACGLFGLAMDCPTAAWEPYVRRSLHRMAAMARRGLAFDMLGTASRERRPGHYHGDPRAFLDFCRAELPGRSRLRCHEWGWNWTVTIRM